jgi:hypothetical protein
MSLFHQHHFTCEDVPLSDAFNSQPVEIHTARHLHAAVIASIPHNRMGSGCELSIRKEGNLTPEDIIHTQLRRPRLWQLKGNGGCRVEGIGIIL